MKAVYCLFEKYKKIVDIAWRKTELIVQATSFLSVHEQIKNNHTHKKRKTDWKEN